MGFVNIRGTFGSGKTTVVLNLIELLKSTGGKEELLVKEIELFDEKKQKTRIKKVKFAQVFSEVEGLTKPILLFGTYGGIACCGADQLNWKGAHDVMRDFIRENWNKYHMLIEGSIASNSRGYLKVAKELKDSKGMMSMFYHLNTPAELCIERVMGRRNKAFQAKLNKASESGKETPEQKEFNPENLHKLFANIKRVKEFTEEANMPVVEVDSSVATSKAILKFFQKCDLVESGV